MSVVTLNIHRNMICEMPLSWQHEYLTNAFYHHIFQPDLRHVKVHDVITLGSYFREISLQKCSITTMNISFAPKIWSYDFLTFRQWNSTVVFLTLWEIDSNATLQMYRIDLIKKRHLYTIKMTRFHVKIENNLYRLSLNFGYIVIYLVYTYDTK